MLVWSPAADAFRRQPGWSAGGLASGVAGHMLLPALMGNYLEANRSNAIMHHCKIPGGPLGKIDDAARHEGATVIYPDNSGAAVAKIRDSDEGAQWEVTVRGRAPRGR